MRLIRGFSFMAASALLLPAGLLAQGTLTGAGSLPHFAVGGGWRTEWVMVNPTDTPNVPVQLNFIGETGVPALLPLNNPLLGTTLPSATSYSAVIPANGLIAITSDSTSSTATSGWVQVSTDRSTTTVLESFQYTSLPTNGVINLQQGGTTTQDALATGYVLPFNEAGNNFTAVAIANRSTNPIQPTVTIRNFLGEVKGTPYTLLLGALEHKSFLVSTQYKIAAGTVGTITFDAGAPGLITVLGLSFDKTNAAFTSIKAIDLHTPVTGN